MKPEKLYEQLKEVAERMSITVSEYSFRNTPLPVKSGHCKIKGEPFFIMDRNLPVHKKNRLLGSHLATLPREEIYIVPGVREFIDRHACNE